MDKEAKPRLTDIEEIKKLGCEATSSDDALKKLIAKKEFNNSSLEKLPKFVTKFNSITELILSGSSVTSVGLAHLSKLPKIESLDVSNIDLTGDGAKTLASLGDVLSSDLVLENTGIDDAGLKHLESLNHLKYVSLTGNDGVTEAGVASLKQAIPGLEVEQ